MAKSVKINYLFNLINTVSGLLFPLVTFPYASRVMMADGIGHVNFFSSIISYISLITCLGIPMYAIREIAKIRDNEVERNKTALEILFLHAMLIILGYLVVAVICCTVQDVMIDIPLFLILSLTIFFTAIGCNWFYQGIEDFKYITIRSLCVHVVSVILLFTLVRTKDDLYWYALYTVVGSLGGNIFNFLRLRKYISLRYVDFKSLRPLKHLLPALHIFAFSLITSIYVHLNSVMLGFMSNDTSVGLFTAASKLSHMLLGLSTALGTTMLPRMSHLISEGRKDEFDIKSRKAMKFVVALSLPVTVGLFVCAPVIIPLFCGDTYYPAMVTLQLLSPIILMISMSNVVGIQILYPLGKINLVIVSTVIGALVNLILNLWLIPIYQQDGAAISTTIAEISVTFSMLIMGRKYFSFNFFNGSYFCYVIAAAIMCLCVYKLDNVTSYPLFQLLLVFMVGLIVYLSSLVLMREQLCMEVGKQMLCTIKKRFKLKV